MMVWNGPASMATPNCPDEAKSLVEATLMIGCGSVAPSDPLATVVDGIRRTVVFAGMPLPLTVRLKCEGSNPSPLFADGDVRIGEPFMICASVTAYEPAPASAVGASASQLQSRVRSLTVT